MPIKVKSIKQALTDATKELFGNKEYVMSLTECSKFMGVSHHTLSKWLVEYGVLAPLVTRYGRGKNGGKVRIINMRKICIKDIEEAYLNAQ